MDMENNDDHQKKRRKLKAILNIVIKSKFSFIIKLLKYFNETVTKNQKLFMHRINHKFFSKLNFL